MSLPTRAMRIKAFLSSPYFWVVVGTTFLPLNLLCALGFGLVTKVRHGKAAMEAKSCINVQLTYMLLFFLPITGAGLLSHFLENSNDAWPLATTLLAALPLGLVSLIGILGLAFFNLRIFAENAFGRKPSAIPRLRFVTE